MLRRCSGSLYTEYRLRRSTLRGDEKIFLRPLKLPFSVTPGGRFAGSLLLISVNI
jgi:hypothetical protein